MRVQIGWRQGLQVAPGRSCNLNKTEIVCSAITICTGNVAISTTSKLALFIDGPNLRATAKALGFYIDCKRLLEEFESRGTLPHAFMPPGASSTETPADWIAVRSLARDGTLSGRARRTPG